jgi:thiol-disulfide isomerase/thioredoxin
VSRHRLLALGALAVFAGTTLLSGCAVGKDAVVQGSDFSFVSPGGKVDIFYPESERKTLPDLSGDSLEQQGAQIHLSDYAGKIVVLNIWGSWCGPCRDEAPELSNVFDQEKAKGVQVVGIDVRDDRSRAQDFVQNNKISYPSIFDPAGRSLLALKGYPRNVVPSTILLDRRHRVAAVYLERVTASKLEPELTTLNENP